MVAFLIISAIIISGCGKLGESEAEKIVRDSCRVPSSFVKHDYQVDEKNNLAYLDFSAKNAFGAELKNRVYFVIRDKQIIPVDTDGIDLVILKNLADASPKNFKENVIYCKDLNRYKQEMDIAIKIFDHTWDRLGGNNNYFVWEHARQEAKQINKLIKKYYDRYYEAPAIVQHQFDMPPAYYKVNLTGDWQYWRANGERPTNYPD